MNPPTVLVVEDNPITRKMIRVTLSTEGYRVVEVADGRSALEEIDRAPPDLILQDLLLPDIDGLALVQRIRAAPKGAAIPVLVISGFLPKIEQARVLGVGFTDYLFKPVEPAHLLHTVHAYLRPAMTRHGKLGGGRRVLVADDDPLQLKLLRVQLEQLGFHVTTARDGVDALEQARSSPPDAIITDVLMPRLDGFRLCLAVRQDSRLDGIPVLLVSAVYTEEADHGLARSVGASAFMLRTPDHREVIDALLACFGRVPQQPKNGIELPLEEYTYRVLRQLEHQIGRSATLTRRLARVEAELGILARVVETLKSTTATEAVLGELLFRCLDAAGISRGAAYLLDQEGRLSLKAQLGYTDAVEGPLADFFGRTDLLHGVLDRGEPLEVNVTKSARDGSADLLAKSGSRSILLAPLLLGEKRLGVLEMASASRELGEDWLSFAKGMSSQIAQALELARALSQLGASEQRYRDLVAGLDAIVWESDGTEQFTFVSPKAEVMLGYPVARWLREPGFWSHLLHPEDRERTIALRNAAIAEGRDHTLAYRAMPADGRVVWLQDTVAIGRTSAGQLTRLRGVMVDITEQRRAEESLQKSDALLRSVMDGITDAVFVKDRDGRYLLMNPAGASFLGRTVADVIGRQDDELFSPETARRIREEDQKVLTTGEPKTFEEAATVGEVTRTFLTTKAPYRDARGNLLGLIGIAVDVTDRIRAREQEAKLRFAREIQQTFFPAAAPRLPGFEVGGASYPAEATGGDYFDYIPLGDGTVLFAIGDASGHGFGAALLMAETRAGLRALIGIRTDLSEILALLNRALVGETAEAHFVTLLLARLDPSTRSFTYASAGHSAAYVFDPAGVVKATVESGAPPLGIALDLHTHNPIKTVSLDPGDLILLLTDGIEEAHSPEGTLFGIHRCLDVVRACRHEKAGIIVERVCSAARAFSRNAPQFDDITVVVIKVDPHS
jgi:PAS domain S-box-containing protein